MIRTQRTAPTWLFAVLAMAGTLVGIFFSKQIGRHFAPIALHAVIPALLFEAAWNLDIGEVKRVWRPVALLVGPGVLIAALLAAGTLVAFAMPLGIAWTLGAALAATDPIAVIALARTLRVPGALLGIVEAESLFNDAFAVALVRARNLLLSILAVVVGALLGELFARVGLLLRLRNAAILWLLSLVGVYTAAFGIEFLGGSGIVAVVAFGIAMRTRIEGKMSSELLNGVEAYWRKASLVLNVVLFAWMGASLDLADSKSVALVSLAVLGALVLGRVVMVYGALRFVREVPASWHGFIASAGMRGALSLALVLGIGQGVPGVRRARAIAFVVVLATILYGAIMLPRGARELKPS